MDATVMSILAPEWSQHRGRPEVCDTEFSWPDRSVVPASDVLDRNWPATVSTLPLGSHVSGHVIGRQPFGVFLLLDGVPNAVGLAEITAMPHDMELPAMGAAVAGEVIWYVDHNRQVKIRLVDFLPLLKEGGFLRLAP